ncbi:MAG TPA: crotonase/enoyl-CoA hydratase family protein [Candidatus Binatia bacterium]|jgi:enoyl-CoA hydratase
MPYGTLSLAVDGRIARLMLQRPERLNAINRDMPRELAAAVAEANAARGVHVIVLSGAGRAFCAGYDLEWGTKVEAEADAATTVWDPMRDLAMMGDNVACFMSLWRSRKPVIAKVHGWCVGGGTDLALCSDLVVAAEDAAIGYPPARVWGSPTTAMWVYRVGMERAKRLLLTGDSVSGREAEAIGLVGKAVPAADLDAEVDALARRMALLPQNQLAMMKLLVNQAYENMGLASTQTLGTLLDGIARHTPEGVAWRSDALERGVRAALEARDGPFGDYGSRPKKAR